ncbi:MAG: YbhB/YbcL family Raf kinase inhibitor-like protein [Bacteroidota bacterium]
MRKKILIRVLIAIPSLIILLIMGRVVFVNLEQKKEFDYHERIPKSINLWSNDFESNGPIPTEYTGLGAEVSPSLYWDNLPSGTQSLVVTTVDYDGPSPNFKLMTIDHWVIHDIDPSLNHIDKAIMLTALEKQGMNLGLNVNGGVGYVGPNPPMGTHEYYFRIYALSVPSLDLVKPSRADLMEKVKDHVIAYGELIGTYRI